MEEQDSKTALVLVKKDTQVNLRHALRLWANSVTALSTERREEILRAKQKAVESFFAFNRKSPVEVTALDVEEWRRKMEGQGIQPTTIYVRVCFLSSFYEWARRDPVLRELIPSNPARLAMPKAPKAYQTESVKAWTDEQLQAIVEAVRKKAEAGDLVGKRDYALLLFYLVTGMRRQEVIGLRGGDIKLEEFIIITGKVKGGDYVSREVRDHVLRTALEDYLLSSGRSSVLNVDGPLWTRHDRAGRPGAALTSHAFVKNLKRYAKEAGVGNVHLHQTRHSFARIVAEETGSIVETQDALNHRSAATTRVYVQRIAVKRDRHSQKISDRLQRKA
jgi:integrase